MSQVFALFGRDSQDPRAVVSADSDEYVATVLYLVNRNHRGRFGQYFA